MTNADDIARFGKRFVRIFYDPMPRNDDTSGASIWCLGRRYDGNPPPNLTNGTTSVSQTSSSALSSDTEASISQATASNNEEHQEDSGWPAPFLDDFESRPWFTYRSGFPSIAKSQEPATLSFATRLRNGLGQQEGFTSDTGWGCMIRSGQSLLANALFASRLGGEWRTGLQPESERELISLFADDPAAPFSLHKFVEHGAQACGKHPGEWFGPSATARCIQALATAHPSSSLAVYINPDASDIYEDALLRTSKQRTGTFESTLILVGIRLGIDRINPVYFEALKASLQMSQSVGIAGGRPSSSLYFPAYQSSQFFYLDPHTTRPALPYKPPSSQSQPQPNTSTASLATILSSNSEDDFTKITFNPGEYTPEEIASCHTRRLRRLDITEMDPSMLIGFLIRDEDDWKAWRKSIADIPNGGKAIVHVSDREPQMGGRGTERASAIDEVESFDEDGLEDDDAEDGDDF